LMIGPESPFSRRSLRWPILEPRAQKSPEIADGTRKIDILLALRTPGLDKIVPKGCMSLFSVLPLFGPVPLLGPGNDKRQLSGKPLRRPASGSNVECPLGAGSR
jgi:hypothetical protein